MSKTTNLVTCLTVIFFLTLLSSCSGLDGRVKQAKDELASRIKTESNGAIELIEFQKTDGGDNNAKILDFNAPSKEYTFDFSATIKYQKDCYKSVNPALHDWEYSSFFTLPQKPEGWESFLDGNPIKYRKGDVVELDGQATFVKNENKWLLKQVEVQSAHHISAVKRDSAIKLLNYANSVYKSSKQPLTVIPIYRKAAAIYGGNYYDAYFNLGIMYNELNNLDSARANLSNACNITPPQADCRFMLAQVYAKANQVDSVEYWLRRASELKEINASDYYLIGTAFGKVGHNLNKAIEYLNKAIEKNPKAELYYEDLAVAYGMAGKFNESVAASLKLIELNPNYPPAYANLSITYRNMGNSSLANEYSEKYKELMRNAK